MGISEARLSKHLRQLAHAGLVRTRWERYYVRYSVVTERIEPLSAALLDFLGAAPDGGTAPHGVSKPGSDDEP